jgi:hypothetical protein
MGSIKYALTGETLAAAAFIMCERPGMSLMSPTMLVDFILAQNWVPQTCAHAMAAQLRAYRIIDGVYRK